MKQGEPVPEVKVGQVWEQREVGTLCHPYIEWGEVRIRTFHVLEIRERGACGGTEPGARCHVVETGRKVTIAIRRMKPGRTRGYRLLSEGATDGAH